MRMALHLSLVLTGAVVAGATDLAAAPLHRRILEAKRIAIGIEVDGRFLTGVDARRAVPWIADDRVLEAVGDAFEEWGRYEIVDRAIEADLFVTVYDATGGERRAFLWERRDRHGLEGTPPPLVRALREAVESAPRKP
ncbi:MAG TPA: hypothetical protein VFM29_07490 [Vicinamibacteria bacterium]|nr:hypothetical protein [Vicinamibacteria bacterium]